MWRYISISTFVTVGVRLSFFFEANVLFPHMNVTNYKNALLVPAVNNKYCMEHIMSVSFFTYFILILWIYLESLITTYFWWRLEIKNYYSRKCGALLILLWNEISSSVITYRDKNHPICHQKAKMRRNQTHQATKGSPAQIQVTSGFVQCFLKACYVTRLGPYVLHQWHGGWVLSLVHLVAF